MRAPTIIGIILIALGIVALIYQGIRYTTRDTIVDIGPIHASKETEHSVPLPPIVGGVAVAAGVVLIIAGARRSRP